MKIHPSVLEAIEIIMETIAKGFIVLLANVTIFFAFLIAGIIFYYTGWYVYYEVLPMF